MKKIEELVRELADRDAIHDLPVRYCDCLWRNDLEGLVRLFTDEALFAVEGRELDVFYRGRAELEKIHQNMVKELRPRPYIHNHVVELRGPNHATGRCYVELHSEEHEEWSGPGYYEDEYVKSGEQWKFASRRHVIVGTRIPLRAFIVA